MGIDPRILCCCVPGEDPDPPPPDPCDCATHCPDCPTTVAITVSGFVVRETRTKVTGGAPHDGLQTAVFEINFNCVATMQPFVSNICQPGFPSCCWSVRPNEDDPWNYSSLLVSWVGSLSGLYGDSTPGFTITGSDLDCPTAIGGLEGPIGISTILRCVEIDGGSVWRLLVRRSNLPSFTAGPACLPDPVPSPSVYNTFGFIWEASPGEATTCPSTLIGSQTLYIPAVFPSCCPNDQDWSAAESCPSPGVVTSIGTAFGGVATHEILSPGTVSVT